MTSIHSSAVVSKSARIAQDVQIGPFAVVEDDVEVGSGSVLMAHSILKDGARIGKAVTVGHFVVVAGLPQDLSFDKQVQTYAEIRDGCELREGVTVNRSTQEGSSTVIGEKALMMANSHAGHDCQVGAGVVFANGVMLAGHVSVGEGVFFGGGSAVHQFVRIGPGAMIGGLARIRQDVPPYSMAAESNRLYGLNIVGLRRRGASRESIRSLQKCYHKVFASGGSPKANARSALDSGLGELEESRVFLTFLSESKRGFVSPDRAGSAS